MQFHTIVLVAPFALLVLTSGLCYAEDPEFAKMRNTYDACLPQGLGDIHAEQDDLLRFFFMSDLERCEDSGYIKSQNVILNMHDVGALVFNWQKAGIWRNSKYPLMPTMPYVQSYQLPDFEFGIDQDAPIQFSPSLERIQPASVFSRDVMTSNTSPNSQASALLPVASSEIQTAFIDNEGHRRDIKLTFNTEFTGDR